MHFSEVKAEMLPESMGTKSSIRWLIREDDGARAAAMRYFQILPGGKIFGHHHPWEHEIFVVRGAGKLRIGSKWYLVDQGTFIFIPPNVEHEYINEGNEPFEFICIIPLKPTAKEEVIKC